MVFNFGINCLNIKTINTFITYVVTKLIINYKIILVNIIYNSSNI